MNLHPTIVPATRVTPSHAGLEHPFVFGATAGAYFRIWLVNLVLTLLTLGIWSAWAKVRRNRFFYGNTTLMGHGFDYLATGATILKGRLVAVALIAVYLGSGYVSEFVQGSIFIAWLVAVPWVVGRALAFRGRNTAWRNVRFHWHGTTGGCARTFLLWPLVTAIGLGLLFPMASQAAGRFIVRNYTFGVARMTAPVPLWPIYRAFGLAILMYIGVGLPLVFGGLYAAQAIVGDDYETTMGAFKGAPALAAGVIGLIAASAFYRARLRNVILNGLEIDGGHRLRSSLSGLKLAWVSLSNLFAILLSFGLLTPWAQVRLWRYQCDNLFLVAGGSVDGLVDAQAESGGALGDEIADFGIGVGV
ncbi:MAG: YjgN family protein [Rhodospirillales bacterium]